MEKLNQETNLQEGLTIEQIEERLEFTAAAEAGSCTSSDGTLRIPF